MEVVAAVAEVEVSIRYFYGRNDCAMGIFEFGVDCLVLGATHVLSWFEIAVFSF